MAEPDRPDFKDRFPSSPEQGPGALAPAEPASFTSETPDLTYVSEHAAYYPDRALEAAKDFAVLACVVLAIFLCTGLALAIAHSLPGYRDVALPVLAADPRVIVGAQVASYPFVLAVMVVLVRIRAGDPFLKAISWNWPSGRGAAFVLLGIIVAFAIEAMAHFLPIPKSLPIDKFFDTSSNAYLMSFFGILLAPLLEELFFRGLLYPLMRRLLGVLVAVLVTAAAFAAIHGAQLGNAWAPILSIFIVGVVLTVVRQWTGSVAACFLTHCGYNSTLFITLWFASDHFRHLDKINV